MTSEFSLWPSLLAKCCRQNWLNLKYYLIDFLLHSISSYIQNFFKNSATTQVWQYFPKSWMHYCTFSIALFKLRYSSQLGRGWYLYCYPQPKLLRSLVHVKCVFCQLYCALSLDIAYQFAKNCQITFSGGWRNCVERYTMNFMTRFACTSTVFYIWQIYIQTFVKQIIVFRQYWNLNPWLFFLQNFRGW